MYLRALAVMLTSSLLLTGCGGDASAPGLTFQPDVWTARPALQVYNPKHDAPAASGGPLTPSMLRHAYGIDQLSGSGAGQTIAIVDAPGDPDAAQALALFSTKFGLPQATLETQFVSGVAPVANDATWGLETDMDIEWAHAIAPQAKILLVVASSGSLQDLLSAVQVAGESANVVSMSWGGVEFSGESQFDGDFTHSGVTYLAAAGDNGGGATWPAASVNVTAVGGTTLTLDASGNRVSEVAWRGGGGGTSTQVAAPSYQTRFQTTGHRTVPDVAYNADPVTGVAVVDSAGKVTQLGGTSSGTPQWAGLVADVNSMRGGALGSLNSNIYNLGSPSSNFFDVTTGGNGSFNAGLGYDEVTGLGSPVSRTLSSALIAIRPSSVLTPSTTSSAPVGSVAVSGTATSAGAISLTWSDRIVGSSSVVLQYATNGQSFSPLKTLTATSGSGTVGGVQANTAYSFRILAGTAVSNIVTIRTP